ncbi:MAG: glycosyl hydrolase family 32 [Anaerolineaceae bacterium]|nr:glycosyl hydrolase family 32 [Anaerolineaceae bacterium]
MLKLANKWVWDFWFAQDESGTHIFYLQADKSLKMEHLRHWNVSVGHAVSQDLRHWEILPDAIAPATTPSWDDFTTWTGSIIRHEGIWYLFYTGSTRRERGYIQRVGYATSKDLLHWERVGTTPLMEADPQRYEKLDFSAWHDEAWRDPYLFRDPETGIFHAYITARVKDGPADGRGVIAHATSPDLHQWAIQEPVTAPGEFGDMEVPQLVPIQGRYYLLFSTSAGHHSQVRRQRTPITPVTGTHYLVSDNPNGPFRYLADEFLVGDENGTLYSGKLVQGSDGNWNFMGFLNFNTAGEFVGEISDPMPVTIGEDGRLLVKKE